MLRLSILSIAILTAPALVAQSSSQSQPNGTASTGEFAPVTVYNSATQQTTTVLIPLQPTSCPVSVVARQSAAASTMEVDRSRPKGISQLLHLSLANAAASPVAKATVTVNGLLPKTRATLTPMTLGTGRSDASRTMEVAFPGPADPTGKSVSAQLWVPGLSAVYSIDLVSVTYADGSIWTASAGKSCRTPIDGMMLIGVR